MIDWQWGNESRLTSGLDRCDPEHLDDLLDSLDLILDDPVGSVLAAPMQGTHDHVDRMVAVIAHGWVLVYSVYPDGIPPATSRPTVVVRSFDKRFDG